MTSFHLYSYATIAEAEVTVYNKDRKTVFNTIKQARPSFDSPRPCFGFIWSNFNNDIRTRSNFVVDYKSKIYINCNPNWATHGNKKNYCALSDDEIDIYLDFVSKVAGEHFTIKAQPFEDAKSSNAFRGVIVELDAKQVHFKKVMVICNMIRYMYEWPEAYNVKQMMVAFKNDLFYDDFGQIFCLYESFMMNQYDQKISACNISGPCYIPILTTEQLANALENMDISKNAQYFLVFKNFHNIMTGSLNRESIWQCNKSREYMSDKYLNRDKDEVDEELLKLITKLYKYILMDESIA